MCRRGEPRRVVARSILDHRTALRAMFVPTESPQPMFFARPHSAPTPCERSTRSLSWWIICCFAWCCTGCTLFPDIRHKPQYHNPFPQLSRIAILPFRNQSQEPTLKGSRITAAYYAEMQAIPGFEILPIGVVENQWMVFEANVLRRPASSAEDFQRFAEYLGVDAVLQGAVTDYTPYYPPRMTIKVNWYASNPGYHPIPSGYGLPWGTKQEKKIPQWIRLEAERSLAREQLKTQTPDSQESPEQDALVPAEKETVEEVDEQVRTTSYSSSQDKPSGSISDSKAFPLPAPSIASEDEMPGGLPASWPDPEGFIPPPPRVSRPPLIAQYEPVISHMKAYNGSDEDFTESLEEYFYFRDDVRFGGWQAYLQRSEDFIRFCCHRHVVETLAARGGQLESRLILRWPIGRYER